MKKNSSQYLKMFKPSKDINDDNASDSNATDEGKNQGENYILSDNYCEIDEESLNSYSSMPSLDEQQYIAGDNPNCDFCGYNYEVGTVVPYEDSNACWHCIFSLNYSPELRKNVDGMFGMQIINYIITYSDVHNKDSCKKNECFLCDFLNGKKITGIQNEEVLIDDSNPDCTHSEDESEEEFVIKI